MITHLAQRIVAGLDLEPGVLVRVDDHAGEPALLHELLLALELAGATPLVDYAPPTYLERLLREGDPALLARRHERRAAWIDQTDRIVVLSSGSPNFAGLPGGSIAAWEAGEQQLTAHEERRRIPFLVVAVPTRRRAMQGRMEPEALEQHLLPALLVDAAELQAEIDRALAVAQGARRLTIRSGDGLELHMDHGDRPWLSDDGVIDAADRARGAIVSNLPAGSIYTTVVEESTHGSLWLPVAGPATDVTLRFAAGRIVEVAAASNAEALAAWISGHEGEPHRVGHIGVGLNPRLRAPIGWTLVDEHIYGGLFLSLGENRYMGGQNASSLNVDFDMPGAVLLADGRAVLS